MNTPLPTEEKVVLTKTFGGVVQPAPLVSHAVLARSARPARKGPAPRRRIRNAARPALRRDGPSAAAATGAGGTATAFDCAAAPFDSVSALAGAAFTAGDDAPGQHSAAAADTIVGARRDIDLAALPDRCDNDVLGDYLEGDAASRWQGLGFVAADLAAQAGDFDHAVGDDVLPGARCGEAAGDGGDAFDLLPAESLVLLAAQPLESEIWGMGDDMLAGAAGEAPAAVTRDAFRLG